MTPGSRGGGRVGGPELIILPLPIPFNIINLHKKPQFRDRPRYCERGPSR